jgi:hypothetical protein
MLADFLGTDPRPRQAHTSQIAVSGPLQRIDGGKGCVSASYPDTRCCVLQTPSSQADM